MLKRLLLVVFPTLAGQQSWPGSLGPVKIWRLGRFQVKSGRKRWLDFSTSASSTVKIGQKHLPEPNFRTKNRQRLGKGVLQDNAGRSFFKRFWPKKFGGSRPLRRSSRAQNWFLIFSFFSIFMLFVSIKCWILRKIKNQIFQADFLKRSNFKKVDWPHFLGARESRFWSKYSIGRPFF